MVAERLIEIKPLPQTPEGLQKLAEEIVLIYPEKAEEFINTANDLTHNMPIEELTYTRK